MANSDYRMSFTTGGLFLRESKIIIELFLKHEDWKIVRKEAIDTNALQSRTPGTMKRTLSEILHRAANLSKLEMQFFMSASPIDQGYLLWISVCRTYQFIADFAKYVLHEKYIMLDPKINHEDFDVFFNQQIDWHHELDSISELSRNKLRQVLFKIMKESDLINENNYINRIIPSNQFFHLILGNKLSELMYFPLVERDIQKMMQ